MAYKFQACWQYEYRAWGPSTHISSGCLGVMVMNLTRYGVRDPGSSEPEFKRFMWLLKFLPFYSCCALKNGILEGF